MILLFTLTAFASSILPSSSYLHILGALPASERFAMRAVSKEFKDAYKNLHVIGVSQFYRLSSTFNLSDAQIIKPTSNLTQVLASYPEGTHFVFEDGIYPPFVLSKSAYLHAKNPGKVIIQSSQDVAIEITGNRDTPNDTYYTTLIDGFILETSGVGLILHETTQVLVKNTTLNTSSDGVCIHGNDIPTHATFIACNFHQKNAWHNNGLLMRGRQTSVLIDQCSFDSYSVGIASMHAHFRLSKSTLRQNETALFLKQSNNCTLDTVEFTKNITPLILTQFSQLNAIRPTLKLNQKNILIHNQSRLQLDHPCIIYNTQQGHPAKPYSIQQGGIVIGNFISIATPKVIV